MASSVDLPWDITIEILSRLPGKSLMRFKCVSISFYNLISNDPLFRMKHLHHQSSLKKVILVPHEYKSTFRLHKMVFPCPILDLSPKGIVRVDMNNLLQLPYPDLSIHSYDGLVWMNGLYVPFMDISFYNTCNGLFCMSMPGGVGADVFIWNPTIRQVKRFQHCPFRFHKLSWIWYTLVHDSRFDVYKLSGLTINDPNTYKLYFYSTETGMWRYIEEPSPCDYVKYDGKPTIVNGALHWLGSNEEHFRMPHVVVSLDISDETYGTLALPQAICDNSKGPILCELKGKICIFSQHNSESHWDLWVMNEYGDVDSMMRMFRMSIVEEADMFAQPFHMFEDDTLVVYRKREIYSYKDGRVMHKTNFNDSKDGRFLDNTIFTDHLYNMVPYVYSESLVSPHTCLQAGEAINHKTNQFSATTNRVKQVVTKKRWPNSCLQRLCFCKRF